MATQTYVRTLVVQDCCNCGMTFGVPAEFDQQMLDTGRNFYCPQGHSQHYTESTVQKLRKQLGAEQARTEFNRKEAQRAREA